MGKYKVLKKEAQRILYLSRLIRSLRLTQQHGEEMNLVGSRFLEAVRSNAFFGAVDADVETEARNINSKAPIPDYLKKP